MTSHLGFMVSCSAVVALLAGAWLFAHPERAYASCADYGSALEVLADSQTVFAGKAVAKRGRTVKFEVAAVWKGDIYETLYMREQLDDGSTCAPYKFDKGTEYLVYLYRGSIVGHRLEEAAQHLAELGPGLVPPKGSTAPVPDVFQEIRIFGLSPRTIGIATLGAVAFIFLHRLYASSRPRTPPDGDSSRAEDVGWFHP